MSANRNMNAAMKGSLLCGDSGMEEYIMKLVPLGDRVVIKALVAGDYLVSHITYIDNGGSTFNAYDALINGKGN